MSMRHMGKARGGAVALVAAALALTLTACGGGEQKPKEPQAGSSGQSQGASQAPVPTGSQAATPTEVIATVQGVNGVVLTVNALKRDGGGFLTLNGQIKNGGSQSFVGTSAWRGNELTSSGESLAGATLIDKAGKKRYYVLRDTDGRCLCTTGVSSIDAGQTVPVFVQFPAPPTNVTEVDFNLPTFATATIKISG
ncbi:hypothetical protein [Streptomyces sp. G-G2]|uniref:hypothetical protein n=1 Tax=Streptomyces sp. G-G2 TaxID=3046201 RepID=UPI0024BAC0F7|nr:hypothetical protein [Streptomyces sp. G-G2]MDJ0384147.1 hypothetical protein [Streptomyces sp. G-G2]